MGRMPTILRLMPSSKEAISESSHIWIKTIIDKKLNYRRILADKKIEGEKQS